MAVYILSYEKEYADGITSDSIWKDSVKADSEKEAISMFLAEKNHYFRKVLVGIQLDRDATAKAEREERERQERERKEREERERKEREHQEWLKTEEGQRWQAEEKRKQEEAERRKTEERKRQEKVDKVTIVLSIALPLIAIISWWILQSMYPAKGTWPLIIIGTVLSLGGFALLHFVEYPGCFTRVFSTLLILGGFVCFGSSSEGAGFSDMSIIGFLIVNIVVTIIALIIAHARPLENMYVTFGNVLFALVIAGVISGVFALSLGGNKLKTPSPAMVMEADPVQPTATVTSDSLNFRSGPGTNTTVINSLKKGDTVTVTGEVQNGWLPVEHGGNKGYVSADMVRINR